MELQPMMTQPTETELALAVQENLFALFRAMAERLPGSEIEEGAKLSRHLTAPTNARPGSTPLPPIGTGGAAILLAEER